METALRACRALLFRDCACVFLCAHCSYVKVRAPVRVRLCARQCACVRARASAPECVRACVCAPPCTCAGVCVRLRLRPAGEQLDGCDAACERAEGSVLSVVGEDPTLPKRKSRTHLAAESAGTTAAATVVPALAPGRAARAATAHKAATMAMESAFAPVQAASAATAKPVATGR
eukprot:2808559-Pleurochrysis_carterae.AAC.1